MGREITIGEFRKLNNLNVIDIRDQKSFLEEHIPNSTNIPYLELIVNYRKFLSKDKIYYLCCEQGLRGRDVTAYLGTKGYKVINLIGGFEEYKNYKYK